MTPSAEISSAGPGDKWRQNHPLAALRAGLGAHITLPGVICDSGADCFGNADADGCGEADADADDHLSHDSVTSPTASQPSCLSQVATSPRRF